MSQTLSLYRLQQTDTRLDRVNARIIEIQKAIEDDEALRMAIIHFEEADDNYKNAQLVLRMAEISVQDQQVKIKQNEANLYSGAVKNPKELQDLQNDVAALKRHLATLENRLLEAMLTCEDTEAVHQNKNQKLEMERQRVADQNSELARELNELARDKDKLSAQRLAISGSISEKLLSLYENLRKQKRGVAVSLVAENACEICGTILTPAQAQAARSSAQMVHCPTCGRILYGN